jgi:hypothetical protein
MSMSATAVSSGAPVTNCMFSGGNEAAHRGGGMANLDNSKGARELVLDGEDHAAEDANWVRACSPMSWSHNARFDVIKLRIRRTPSGAFAISSPMLRDRR